MLRIRRARAEECDELRALARSAKRHWGYTDEYMTAWGYDRGLTAAFIEEHAVWCAEIDSAVVGFYALSPAGALRELEHLWVAPDRIGVGVGKALFDDALVKLRTEGARALHIVADPHAEGFYRRMGAQLLAERRPGPLGQEFPVLLLEL